MNNMFTMYGFKQKKTKNMFDTTKATTEMANGISKWLKRRKQKKIDEMMLLAGNIDEMPGEQFERILCIMFEKLGYKSTHVGQSGDFGADIILQNSDGKRIIVQAKRYSENVGNSAVQEVYSAIPIHNGHEGWVVTNSYYTKAAVKQANGCGVKLIDRDGLFDMLKSSQKHDEKIKTSEHDMQYSTHEYKQPTKYREI